MLNMSNKCKICKQKFFLGDCKQGRIQEFFSGVGGYKRNFGGGGGLQKNFFEVKLTKKTLKTYQKFVYIHFCYLFKSRKKNWGGGDQTPLPPVYSLGYNSIDYKEVHFFL